MKACKKVLFAILVTSLLVAVFVGWGKQPVELLNETPPLIDLDSAIKEPDFGQNGDTGGETGDPNEELPGGNGGKTQQEAKNKVIVISIRREELRYGYQYGQNTENERKIYEGNLRTRLASDFQEGDVILLVDDFAEAHFYRKILRMLEELRDEEGMEFSEDIAK